MTRRGKRRPRKPLVQLVLPPVALPAPVGDQSDVARIKAEITDQYAAAHWALSGPAIVGQHAFITRRMERIGILHEELTSLVGEDESARLLVQQLEASSEPEEDKDP